MQDYFIFCFPFRSKKLFGNSKSPNLRRKEKKEEEESKGKRSADFSGLIRPLLKTQPSPGTIRGNLSLHKPETLQEVRVAGRGHQDSGEKGDESTPFSWLRGGDHQKHHKCIKIQALHFCFVQGMVVFLERRGGI